MLGLQGGLRRLLLPPGTRSAARGQSRPGGPAQATGPGGHVGLTLSRSLCRRRGGDVFEEKSAPRDREEKQPEPGESTSRQKTLGSRDWLRKPRSSSRAPPPGTRARVEAIPAHRKHWQLFTWDVFKDPQMTTRSNGVTSVIRFTDRTRPTFWNVFSWGRKKHFTSLFGSPG